MPLVYKSGRRALITMEKGLPGDKVFDEAIKAWQPSRSVPANSGLNGARGIAAPSYASNTKSQPRRTKCRRAAFF